MCKTVYVFMEDLKGQYIRWSDNCVWQRFGMSLAILRVSETSPGSIPEKNQGIQLNEAGRDIWDLCDGTRTLESIINQVLQEYEGDPERIRKNVEETVSMLKDKGFITYEKTLHPYTVCEISPQHSVIWDESVLWNEEEGHVVAMNNYTGIVLPLPDEAGELWKLCNGKKSVGEIFSLLKSKGIINKEMPSARFTLLLKQWIKLGMITVGNAPL